MVPTLYIIQAMQRFYLQNNQFKNACMRKILFVVFLFQITSCSKHEKVSTEYKDLPQPIQKIINIGNQDCPECGMTLNLFKWKGQNIYGAICNGPACNCAYIYYDNSGNTISVHIELYKEIFSDAVFVSRIWSCSN